jgi:protein ImuA
MDASEAPGADCAAIVAHLRRFLPAAEARSCASPLPFGVPNIDAYLPAGGLARGALHEVTATETAAMPSAFGFVAALLGHALKAEERGQALLVLSRGSADFGQPYGHGLSALGLSPDRLILVEAASDREALWAVEEALRLRAVAAVAGWIAQKLGLKASRRLQVAAEASGALLLVLRPPEAEEEDAATTRWRVGAASAVRDRFGCFERWRWRLSLERCRNGRPGAWVVELSDAHRFGLSGPLAHPALLEGAGSDAVRRAG